MDIIRSSFLLVFQLCGLSFAFNNLIEFVLRSLMFAKDLYFSRCKIDLTKLRTLTIKM